MLISSPQFSAPSRLLQPDAFGNCARTTAYGILMYCNVSRPAYYEWQLCNDKYGIMSCRCVPKSELQLDITISPVRIIKTCPDGSVICIPVRRSGLRGMAFYRVSLNGTDIQIQNLDGGNSFIVFLYYSRS